MASQNSAAGIDSPHFRPEAAALTEDTVEMLQALIRKQCVNDGTAASGNEELSAKLLRDYVQGPGVESELFEPAPTRTSLISRLDGTDPKAPALCLMGHTDVVPAEADKWRYDPFGGELIDGEIWGRGAVDMLNLTSSMAVVFKHLAKNNIRYPGDIIFFAVADEEAGGTLGAEQLVTSQWDALRCDYLLTEFGGVGYHKKSGESTLLLSTAEKGVAWRRLKITGTPGHGSTPFGANNPLITAAEVVRRISQYSPAARLDEQWRKQVDALDINSELTQRLLDPTRVEAAFNDLPQGVAAQTHACCHSTLSVNVVQGGTKTNVIPSEVIIEVDIRTLPGETAEDVQNHLALALGPLLASVEVQTLQQNESTSSNASGPLWDAVTTSMNLAYPHATISPSIITVGTDARFFRQKGVTAYGAGLLSDKVDAGEFYRRFHGHNERIDVDSLKLTVQLWLDVLDRLWAH